MVSFSHMHHSEFCMCTTNFSTCTSHVWEGVYAHHMYGRGVYAHHMYGRGVHAHHMYGRGYMHITCMGGGICTLHVWRGYMHITYMGSEGVHRINVHSLILYFYVIVVPYWSWSPLHATIWSTLHHIMLTLWRMATDIYCLVQSTILLYTLLN